QIDCTWRFVFDEEFNGSAINTSQWDEGWLPGGTVGGAGQLASLDPSDDCLETGGFLVQELQQTGPNAYSTCSLDSVFSQSYGFFQWKGYMPSAAAGAWAAYWMFSGVNGPEFDAAEVLGSNPKDLKTTWHNTFADYTETD